MAKEATARLSVALDAVALSGVTGMAATSQGLVFKRPVLDNAQVMKVCPDKGAPCLLTLAPGNTGAMHCEKKVPAGSQQASQIEEIEIDKKVADTSICHLAMQGRSGDGRDSITEARILVSAGRGIGDPTNLEQIRALVNALPGAALSASRPLVDQGWVSYSRQVGITGAIVAPDLYLACGISGSSQHLAGMGGAKWVVSINKSVEAPICRRADLCIQADVNQFIKAYLD